jgi:hypothetical protein
MFQAGIIASAKVVRATLQDAASVAGLLITTEATVAEWPKKEAAPAMPGGGGVGRWTCKSCRPQTSRREAPDKSGANCI